jgi:hypothetical protein
MGSVRSGGPAASDEAFWERCLDVLAPSGRLAANWADFAVNPAVRPMAEALSAVTRTRGFEPFFVTGRGFRDNLAQYVPRSLDAGLDTIGGAPERFALQRPLPDPGRGILENCLVMRHFPNRLTLVTPAAPRAPSYPGCACSCAKGVRNSD